jgi:hypothetical protein
VGVSRRLCSSDWKMERGWSIARSAVRPRLLKLSTHGGKREGGRRGCGGGQRRTVSYKLLACRMQRAARPREEWRVGTLCPARVENSAGSAAVGGT